MSYNSPIGAIKICYEDTPGKSGELVLLSSRFLQNSSVDESTHIQSVKPLALFRILDDYFSGLKPDLGSLIFRYPLRSTALQLSVWLGLSKISYGTSVSYKNLACAIGFPNAVRAVASACGANPFQLFIPCHRVVRSDGGIGGFQAGIDVKEFLLKQESAEFVG